MKGTSSNNPWEPARLNSPNSATVNARFSPPEKTIGKKGADGKPLPYIDKIIYLDMAKDAAVAAISAGQVDSVFKTPAQQTS